MSNPKVTVAIPTFNRLSYLQLAVASAMAQTYTEIEILVSLDPDKSGPDQEIVNYCSALVHQNQRFVFNVNLHNRGLGGNWNACLEHASGAYILIIGDDDLLLPFAVEKLMYGISFGAQVSFSNHYLINSKGERLEETNTALFNRQNLQEGFLNDPEKYIWQNVVPASTSLIALENARRFKFKEDLNTPEIEMFLNIAGAGGKFYFTPQFFIEYRVHGKSSTAAGLKVHLLYDYLIHVPVADKNFIYKKEFLSGISEVAITNQLKLGNKDKAFKIWSGLFYRTSQRVSVKGIVKLFLLILPNRLVKYILTK